MVGLRYILFFVLFVFSISFSNAQNYFYKTYNGGLYDVGQGVCEMPDEHYAVTGSTSSIDGSSQAFIMVIDSVGDQVWTKGYGADGVNWGRRIFHRETEGFWVMGYSTAYGDGDFEFVVWKIDDDGEEQWVQNFGTIGWDRLWDAVELDNGDFILVGETEGANSQDKDVYMLRIDDQGNEVWETQLANNGDDIAYAATLFDDTTVIVVGEYYENEQNVGLLLNMHVDGTINSQWTYDDEGPTTFLDVDVWNEQIFLAGGVERSNNGYLNSINMAVDVNNDLISLDITNWQEDDYSTNIISLSSDRVYWVMESFSPDLAVFSGGSDVFILKFHSQLYFLGVSVPHAGVDPDEFHQMLPTTDGGFIAVGFCSDNRVVSSIGSNVMVTKFGPNDEYQSISDENEDFLYLESNLVSAGIKIYPNPTNGYVKIEVDEEVERTEIIDGRGKLIDVVYYANEVDFSTYDKGIYFLRLFIKNKFYYQKIILN